MSQCDRQQRGGRTLRLAEVTPSEKCVFLRLGRACSALRSDLCRLQQAGCLHASRIAWWTFRGPAGVLLFRFLGPFGQEPLGDVSPKGWGWIRSACDPMRVKGVKPAVEQPEAESSWDQPGAWTLMYGIACMAMNFNEEPSGKWLVDINSQPK